MLLETFGFDGQTALGTSDVAIVNVASDVASLMTGGIDTADGGYTCR